MALLYKEVIMKYALLVNDKIIDSYDSISTAIKWIEITDIIPTFDANTHAIFGYSFTHKPESNVVIKEYNVQEKPKVEIPPVPPIVAPAFVPPEMANTTIKQI